MAASLLAQPVARCQTTPRREASCTHKLGGELLNVRDSEQAHPQDDLALQDPNGLDNPGFPICLLTGQEKET